jgi:hypothetical protein
VPLIFNTFWKKRSRKSETCGILFLIDHPSSWEFFYSKGSFPSLDELVLVDRQYKREFKSLRLRTQSI